MKNIMVASKEIKKAMEKVVTAIDKKSGFENYKHINFVNDINGLKLITGHSDQMLEIYLNAKYDYDIDSFAIDYEDIKAITKLSGDVYFAYDTDNKNVNITCGKKKITLMGYEPTDFSHLVNDKNENTIFTTTADWFIDTMARLVNFTDKNSVRKALECVNFNTLENQVEACDGYKAVTRTMNNTTIENKTNVLINSNNMAMFKKLIDKKDTSTVVVSQGNKCVVVSGNGFRYTQRKLNLEFLNVKKLFDGISSTTQKAIIDTSDFLNVLKYDCDIITSPKDNPIFMHADNNKLYSFVTNGKIDSMDEITTDSVNINSEFYVCYNPSYLYDIISNIDTNKVEYSFNNEKAITYFTGDGDYNFLVLPILPVGTNNVVTNGLNRFKSNF
jgi:DNA polymerase III sliding clamp (beta) subunit (PCNA family)